MGYRNIKKQINLFLFFKLTIFIFQCPGTAHITNFTRMPHMFKVTPKFLRCNGFYLMSFWRSVLLNHFNNLLKIAFASFAISHSISSNLEGGWGEGWGPGATPPQTRQACSPLIQLFFGLASESEYIRDGNWLSTPNPPLCI